MQESPKIPKARRMTGPSMLDNALEYLGRGWNVIPVSKSKRPLLPTWKEYQERRVTEEEIRTWWGKNPTAGVAILTGRISGIVVVDADTEEGAATVERYMLHSTLEAETGGGGRHYYFKHPGREVPSLVRFMPGVDIRGDGGYVVVPPSPHASGRRYRWRHAATTSIAEMPVDLLRLVHPQRRERLAPSDWKTDIEEGKRDSELTRRAGKLFRAGMQAAEVLDVLWIVNKARCKPPLPRGQVQKIVESIAGRERMRRDKAEGGFTVAKHREMRRQYGEDETRWTIAEWLPEASCGLVVAPPGNYKTWMLEALAYSVATGHPFLNRWAVTQPGPVLIIQQEDPWNMLLSRLDRMFEQEEPSENGKIYELDCRFESVADSMPVYWYTDRKFWLSDKKVMTELEEWVARNRPQVVIIDPLYTAAETKDYMAEGAQRMIELKRMRDKYQCSFVVAHHTTVAGSVTNTRAAIWGSQFLNAWLEFGWRTPEGDSKGNVITRHFKGTGNLKPIRIKFEITDFSFSADVDENYRVTEAEQVEELIRTGAVKGSVREISEKTGFSKSVVGRVMKSLKEKEE